MLTKINLFAVVFLNAISAFADGPALPAGTAPVTPAGQTAPAVTGPTQGMSFGTFLPIIVMFVVFYLFMVRPQQKKLKEHQDLLANLKHGDEVVTAAGILGKITGIAEKVVTVEIADSVKIKVMKNQIAQVVKGNI